MPKAEQLPAELHVEIYRGDDWSLSFDFNIDLTGYTITAAVHPKDGGDDVAITVTEVDYSLGQFTTSLTAAQTAALDEAYHTWCLVLTPPASTSKRTYVSGRYIVSSCS
jgi:hypothetical protein